MPLLPGFKKLFPGIHPVPLVASVLFFTPIIRDFVSWCGVRQVGFDGSHGSTPPDNCKKDLVLYAMLYGQVCCMYMPSWPRACGTYARREASMPYQRVTCVAEVRPSGRSTCSHVVPIPGLAEDVHTSFEPEGIRHPGARRAG